MNINASFLYLKTGRRNHKIISNIPLQTQEGNRVEGSEI